MEGIVRALLILDPYEQWGLPKGHVERGEGPRDAALREVREETGLTELEAGTLLETIDWRFMDRGVLVHKFCDFFLMHSPRGDAEPQEEEGIRRCLWLPMDAAVSRVDYANAREVVRSARELVAAGTHDLGL